MVVAFVLLVLCVYLFCREVRLDHNRFLELDKRNDERILRDINRYLEAQEIKKASE